MSNADLQALFVAFREECIWLRRCFNTYSVLFASGADTADVLHRSAAWFFHDLERTMREYCYLQNSENYYPKKSFGRENLTHQLIDFALREAGLMSDEIAALSQELLRYRELIRDPRSKLIAHLDRELVTTGLPLGTHSEKDVHDFLRTSSATWTWRAMRWVLDLSTFARVPLRGRNGLTPDTSASVERARPAVDARAETSCSHPRQHDATALAEAVSTGIVNGGYGRFG